MKLTCVTATFNALAAGNRDKLIRCVESVAKIKTSHEHLIYDGASTDGTVELLRELEAKTPGLRVVSEPDMGIYNALNKGVRDAQGEWFYVLGVDDYICCSEVLDEVVTTESLDTQIIVSPVERDGRNPFFQKMSDMRKIFWTVPYSHQGLVMRTSFVRRMGGFDERYRICADWDMMLKAHERVVKHHYTFRPFAFYAVGGMSENGDGRGWQEVTDVLQRHLRLTDKQTARFRRVGFPPLSRMLPMLFHRDPAFRMSARMMVLRWSKYWIRLVLLPLVVISRPVRMRLRRQTDLKN